MVAFHFHQKESEDTGLDCELHLDKARNVGWHLPPRIELSGSLASTRNPYNLTGSPIR